MNQDKEQLRLLSIFHYVVAGLAAFIACFPIMYLVIGLIMIFRLEKFGPSKDQPPAFLGVLLTVMGAMLMLLGWAFAGCIAYAGRCLKQRRRYTFCMVMAGIACLFTPFGTVLGIFTIMVLIRPSVKALFNVAPPTFAT